MEQRFLTHRRREQPCLLGPFTRPHLEPRLPARPPKSTPPLLSRRLAPSRLLQACRSLCPQPQLQPRVGPLPLPLRVPATSSLSQWQPRYPHSLWSLLPSICLSRFIAHLLTHRIIHPNRLPLLEEQLCTGRGRHLSCSLARPRHTAWHREPFLNLWCSDQSINECGALEALPAWGKRSQGRLAPGMAKSQTPRGLAGGRWVCPPWFPVGRGDGVAGVGGSNEWRCGEALNWRGALSDRLLADWIARSGTLIWGPRTVEVIPGIWERWCIFHPDFTVVR